MAGSNTDLPGDTSPVRAGLRRTLTASRIRSVALVVLAAIPPLVMWHLITATRVPLPVWDEWFTPGDLYRSWCVGTLSFADLFVQHNESRKLFPRLLYLLLAQLHGWDVRDAMTLVFAEVCLLCLLLYLLLRRTAAASRAAVLTGCALVSFLCFAPAQFENFLWGIQLETFFPGVAVAAAALVNLSRLSFPARFFCNLALTVVATFTYANGLLLWALALPIAAGVTPRRKIVWWYVGWIAAGVCAMLAYFHGYEQPENVPAWEVRGRNVADLAQYPILWFGAYFRSAAVSAWFAGAVALATGVLTFGGIVAAIRRSQQWRPFYPWLLLGTYSVATCAIIAWGRSPFGVHQALDTRYGTFSLFFYLAIVGGCCAVYATLPREATKTRQLFLASTGVLIAVASAAWLASYRDGLKALEAHRRARLPMLAAFEWVNVIPDNPDLARIFPLRDWLLERTRILSECGVLRTKLVGEPLASAVKEAPANATGAHGGIDVAHFDEQGNLRASGWAWLPDQNRPADRVVIGCEAASGLFRPISVARTGGFRPDLREHFGRRNLERAGFGHVMQPANLPDGAIAVSAWAIDLRKQRAHPLGGRWMLTRP